MNVLASQLLKQPPRWLVWLLVVLAIAAAYGTGRLTATVEVEERVEVKFIDHYVSNDHTKKAVVRTVYIEKLTTDAGMLEKTSIKEEEKTDTTKLVKRDTENTSSSSRVTTVPLPNWRIGVLVGATWKEPALPVAGPLVLGVHAERRIVGPISAGAWGTTQGAVGVSVTGEF